MSIFHLNSEKKSFALFILSFITLIFIGTLLLRWLSHCDKAPMNWLDALFMSCSATCLSGFTVVDISKYKYVQVVLVLLMQVGVFGIIYLSSVILLLTGKKMSLNNLTILHNLNNHFTRDNVSNVVRTIFSFIIITEILGTTALTISFRCQGYSWSQSLWYGVFYSIGSFCNGGIGPLDLTDGKSVNDGFKVISWILMVCGGVGIYVIYDLLCYCRLTATQKWFFRRNRKYTDAGPRPHTGHLQLNTKISVATAVVCGLAGAILLYYPLRDRFSFLDALYLSTSARTAGYSTINLNEVISGGTNTTPAYSASNNTEQTTSKAVAAAGTDSDSNSIILVILTLLMLIGGAPGSAAGGIKTTTVAIAVLACISSFRDREISVFRRTIPPKTVMRSFAIVIAFLVITLIGGYYFDYIQKDTNQRFSTAECFFETASAVSATGLSLLDKKNIVKSEKIFLIVMMFIGRIGPVMLIILMFKNDRKLLYRYPEESVAVG